VLGLFTVTVAIYAAKHGVHGLGGGDYKPTAGGFVLLTGVLLGSLAAGLGMAFLLSQLKPTFFDARSLRSYTGMPMLGTVSMLTDSVTRSRRRQSVLAFSTTSVLYLVLFGALIAWYTAKTLLVR